MKHLSIYLLIGLLLLAGCVDARGYPLGPNGEERGRPLQVELDGVIPVETTVTVISGNLTTFLELSDTPDTYVGQAGEYVRVNAGETALEFGTPAGGGDMTKAVYDPDDDGVIAAAQLDTTVVIEGDVDDTPANGATTDPISSNWAFDHTDNTTTHGATGVVVGTTNTQELDNKTLDSSVGKGTWTVSGTWTLPAMTFGGNVTLGEVTIYLDPALSADGYASGIAEAGTAGATLAFGDLIYLAVADSRWELADADSVAAGTMKLGICIQAAAADGSATVVLLWGKVRADAVFPAMTIGAPVFMSATDGDVTSTAPSGAGDIVRIIGYANTADELFFNPDATWIELA